MKKIMMATIVLLAIVSACSKDDFGKIPGPKKSEASFDATFTSQTVYFDSSEASKDVVSIDLEKNIFTFKNSSEKAKKLKKGDVVLIHGQALGKANRVTTSGSNIVVETVEATLDELIEDGTIEWKTYCDFPPETDFIVLMDDKTVAPITRASKGTKFSFNFGPYKYSINMDMKKEYANVKLEVSKSVGPLEAKMVAEGRISSFYSENKIVYKKSKVTNYSNTNSNLQGDLTLSLVINASGNDYLDVEMPVVLLAYPVMVGPILTVIKVKLQILINTVVPVEGSAQISTKFKYSSQTGFVYDGVKTSAKAQIGNFSIDKTLEPKTGAPSAIAVNFGIGFPRLEIGIFGQLIVPWIQTAFLIGGDYTAFPACRQARAAFIGGCGVNFTFLGKEGGAKAIHNLWNEEKVIFKTGDCR